MGAPTLGRYRFDRLSCIRNPRARHWALVNKTVMRQHGEKISNEIQDLVNKQDRGLAAAVRGAREMPAGSTGAGSFDSDVGTMTDSEFARYKNEVFAAAKSGQLK